MVAFLKIEPNQKSNRMIASLVCTFAALVFWLHCNTAAAQVTPESPKVRRLVELGVKYLEASNPRDEYFGGVKVMIGYTIFKATGDPDHPKVKEGVEVALQKIRDVRAKNSNSSVIYEVAVSAVLLAEVDSAKYKYDLQAIADWLVSVQKPHGGFGYLTYETGDTSQVQYAMLGLWTLQNSGVNVPPTVAEGIVNYLRETQDPSGGWGYQGRLGNGRLVPQERVTKSLGTAGAGALLIAGDMLGFFRIGDKLANEDDGIPPAFIRSDTLVRRGKVQTTLQKSDLDEIVKRMIQYHDRTQPNFEGGQFYYYWRYSQERYESFREVMEGKQNKSPAWYVSGVDELSKLQSPNGAWTQASKNDHTSDEICTCFAVLFLVRSTQKAIVTLKEGVLGGGYGLPDDLTTVRRVQNRIVNDAEVSVENLLAMMESGPANNVEFSLLPKNLQLSKDPAVRKDQVARFSRLIRNGDYNARRLAAKLLGRSEDLNQVPDLIFALNDNDPYVPMIAEESLRLLSRKLRAGNLEAQPSPEQRAAAQKYWKQWYLGINPDYVFLD